MFGDTCREKTIRVDHAWLRAKHDSNGESFSVIEHRGLDRKRITKTRTEQLSRVFASMWLSLSISNITANSFFLDESFMLAENKGGRTKDELARIENFQAQINGDAREHFYSPNAPNINLYSNM